MFPQSCEFLGLAHCWHRQVNSGLPWRWSGSLDFSLVLMDDFQVVLRLKFFDQMPVFPLQAVNSLNILIRNKTCVVLIERTVMVKPKALSGLQFKQGLKLESSYLTTNRKLNNGEDFANSMESKRSYKQCLEHSRM